MTLIHPLKTKPPKYCFLSELEDQPTCPIRIKTGKFSGIEYAYGKVSFDENTEGIPDKHLRMNFQYFIIKNPNDIEDGDELKSTVGDILVELIEMKKVAEEKTIRKQLENSKLKNKEGQKRKWNPFKKGNDK
tara:strand:- start:531 stop:926 length:396 start_codon:yes stop_codon:yes gene_type:complete